MPYRIREDHGRYVVYNPEDGHVFGRHPTRADAERQQEALYAETGGKAEVADEEEMYEGNESEKGAAVGHIVSKAMDAEINLEPGEPAFVAWLTLDNVDREGDVVIPSGVDFRSEYLDTNPVVMACHEYNRWPVGQCAWIKPKRNRGFNGLIARALVDVADPDSRRLFGMVQRRVVRSVSIGFRPPDDFKPGEWGAPTPEELKSRPDWANARRVIRRCVLIEFSIVPIGMNQLALIDAVSKGLELPSYLSRFLPGGKSMDREAFKRQLHDTAKALVAEHYLEHGQHRVYLHDQAAGHVHWQADPTMAPEIAPKIEQRMKAVPGVEVFCIKAMPPDNVSCFSTVYPDVSGRALSAEITPDAADQPAKALAEGSGTGGGYVTGGKPKDKDTPPPATGGGGGEYPEKKDEMETDAETPEHMKLKAGDYVEHGEGRHAIVGKIVSIHKRGFVPGVEEDVEGTEQEPAAKVNVYLRNHDTGKHHPTDKHVGRMCKELKKVPHELSVKEDEPMSYPEEKAFDMPSTASEIKGVVPFAGGPIDDAPWDASAARAGLAKWASSDGSGAKEKMDWAKYEKGFAWVDGDRKEEIGGYRLPHHCVKGGELYVSKRGVEAAYGAIQGARGGVSIPDADKAAVEAHLSKHYAEFGAVPGKDGKAIMIPAHKTLDEIRTAIDQKSAEQFNAEAMAQRLAEAVIDKAIGAV